MDVFCTGSCSDVMTNGQSDLELMNAHTVPSLPVVVVLSGGKSLEEEEVSSRDGS